MKHDDECELQPSQFCEETCECHLRSVEKELADLKEQFKGLEQTANALPRQTIPIVWSKLKSPDGFEGGWCERQMVCLEAVIAMIRGEESKDSDKNIQAVV